MGVTIQEFRPGNIGNAGVSLTVNDVDNELTAALNGTPIVRLTGPAGPGLPFNTNLTGSIIAGQPNVLAVAVCNFAGGGFNPSSCDAFLDVGGDRINLSFSENGVPDGLTALFTVILQK